MPLVSPAPPAYPPLSVPSKPRYGARWLLHLQAAASRIDAWARRPRSPQRVVLALSLYLLLTANWPLWNEMARIGGAPSLYGPVLLAMALVTACGTVALLAFTAWSRAMKPLWLAIVAIAAVAQHYMLAYRVVMDPSMLANAFQTDLHEVRDLLGARFVLDVLVVFAPAAWFIARLRLAPATWRKQAGRNALLLTVALAAGVGGAVAMNRQLAPLMRNHVHLRYMINPLASVYSAARVVVKPWFQHRRKLVPMSAGVALGPSYAAANPPPLLVLVVGETARADHFGLNGYARDTTPELAARQVLSFRNVHSCGTNTLASVPCMFSPLGKQAFESRTDDYENLVDVLQAAGLAVLWIDNQPGGCKGVCDRVPHVSAAESLDASSRAALCDGDECRDEALLKSLDARLAGLPAERRARGVVLVMHQMGSHGPAYYKRTPASAKRFMPECTTNDLSACSHAELINGFDNTIAYTDQVLARTIDWLRAQKRDYQPGLLYLSDHGESLGEYGLFLHGVPYAFAPEVQKHVPMVAWLDPALERRVGLAPGCLASRVDAPLTHDNLYHTVLGLLDVQAPSYAPALDAFAPCRAAAGKLAAAGRG